MRICRIAAVVVMALALTACSDRQSPTNPVKAPSAPSAVVGGTSLRGIDSEIDGLFTGFARLYEHAYWNWIVAQVSSCSSKTVALKIDADLDALLAYMQSHSKYFTSTQAQKLVKLTNDVEQYVDDALAKCGTSDA